MRVREPSACQHCGISKRRHGRRFTEGAGYHQWQRPTQATIYARMLLRRGDPNRWIPASDMRTTWRKWK